MPVLPLLLPIVATPIVKDLLPTKFGDIFHLAILILYKVSLQNNSASIGLAFNDSFYSIFFKKKWHDKIIHSLETKSQELNIIEVQIDELLLELEQSAEEFNLDD